MEITGEFLTQVREGMLQAAAENPLYPWPGPPEGMEDKPGASRMGNDACMRQVWFDILSRTDPDFDYEKMPREGTMEIAPQRGWALEAQMTHLLERARVAAHCVEVHAYAEAVIGPDNLFFGHPDGYAIINNTAMEREEDPDTFLLEYKHQRGTAYMRFLKEGVQSAEPLYYSQAQAYMLATGMDKTLFVISPFDVSGTKGDITIGKRRKNYEGNLEPDFRMVPDCSGVHPAYYLEMIEADAAYQEGLLDWCKDLACYVKNHDAPDRRYDMNKAWQCQYCSWQPACLHTGACKECEHKGCGFGQDAAGDGEYRARG